MNKKETIKRIEELIAKNEVTEAIQLALASACISADYRNSIILLSSQYEDWEKKMRLGLGPGNHIRSRVIYSFLSILTKIELEDERRIARKRVLGSKYHFECLLKEANERYGEIVNLTGDDKSFLLLQKLTPIEYLGLLRALLIEQKFNNQNINSLAGIHRAKNKIIEKLEFLADIEDFPIEKDEILKVKARLEQDIEFVLASREKLRRARISIKKLDEKISRIRLEHRKLVKQKDNKTHSLIFFAYTDLINSRLRLRSERDFSYVYDVVPYNPYDKLVLNINIENIENAEVFEPSEELLDQVIENGGDSTDEYMEIFENSDSSSEVETLGGEDIDFDTDFDTDFG